MTNYQQSQSKKILIVGQGMAGTILAHTLANYPSDVTIIDNAHKSAASVAASGTYNPLVLKRLVKSWEIDTLLPFAYKFYQEVSERLSFPLLTPQMHYRKIAQDSELLDWHKKLELPEYSKYLSSIKKAEEVHHEIDAPWGYGAINNVGRIDISKLLYESKSYFKNTVISEQFDFSRVKPTNEYVEYNGHKYDHIIFCEGYKIIDNPFFPDVKMKPVKGENLVLKIPGLNLKHVIKTSMYILPVGDDTYHIGSTYDWEILDEIPSKEARETLLAKLKTITTLPYEIVDQMAGVRPSSKDRRPIIGPSKDHNNLHVLNGLGAKGLMLAPYFSHQLCEFIYNDKPIDEEVNIKRFQVSKN